MHPLLLDVPSMLETERLLLRLADGPSLDHSLDLGFGHS